MIRTLVSASSALARAGLAAIVRGDSRLALAGEASPLELERAVRALDPDVVLEQRDGPSDGAHVPTVALVDDPREAWAAETFVNTGDSGGRAILSRDATPDAVVAAVVAVAAGLVAVQPRALAPAAGAGAAGTAAERLTAREVEVLGELSRGVPNKTIATRLAISEHTVKFHIASIFAKLGVASRTEAVTQGVRLGLIML